MINLPVNISIIRGELEKILNRPVRVEFENISSGKSPAPGGEKPVLGKDEMEAVENNPVFKKITEMFEAEVVCIRPG
jgi:hypothetical protein